MVRNASRVATMTIGKINSASVNPPVKKLRPKSNSVMNTPKPIRP